MIVKTPGSQMGSPAVAEGGGEARGGGRGESGERSGVQAGSTLESTVPKARSRSREVETLDEAPRILLRASSKLQSSASSSESLSWVITALARISACPSVTVTFARTSASTSKPEEGRWAKGLELALWYDAWLCIGKYKTYRSFFNLRWGWVFLERTRILSEIQFTTHFIEFFVVETKRFVGSLVHVILTRQTCGQRSSRAAESKHRALRNYFFEQICYMYLISKCRGDWDLALCTTSGAAFGEPQRNGDFWEKTCFDAGNIKFCHCAAVLQTQVPKLCTDLDLSLLYILIFGTYSKFARKNNFLALGVCLN